MIEIELSDKALIWINPQRIISVKTYSPTNGDPYTVVKTDAESHNTNESATSVAQRVARSLRHEVVNAPQKAKSGLKPKSTIPTGTFEVKGNQSWEGQ